MASIYIHIPFCFQRCDYCNFFSSTRLQQKSAYLLALKKELILRKNYLEAEPIESIYFLLAEGDKAITYCSYLLLPSRNGNLLEVR